MRLIPIMTGRWAFAWASLFLVGGLGFAALLSVVAPGLLSLVPAFIGLALVMVGALNQRRYSNQRHWLGTTARLLEVREVVEEVAMGYRRSKYFYPEIEYEYQVDGRRSLGQGASCEKQNVWVPEVGYWGDPIEPEARWWSGLQRGQTIEVFVDPRDPSQALLRPLISAGRRPHHFALVISGVLILLASAGLTVLLVD